jgi:hypothetical protein
MGTIKVKFKDGSMADVDEQVLPQAQKAGATIIESGSAPISGNVTVRFKDGSEAQINADVKDKALQAGAIIISEGGVKKKEPSLFSGGISKVGVGASSQNSNNLPAQPVDNGATGLIKNPNGTVSIEQQPSDENNDLKPAGESKYATSGIFSSMAQKLAQRPSYEPDKLMGIPLPGVKVGSSGGIGATAKSLATGDQKQLEDLLGKMSTTDISFDDLSKLHKISPQKFEQVKELLNIPVNADEVPEGKNKDENYVWRVYDDYRQRLTETKLNISRQKRSEIGSQLEENIPAVSEFTGNKYAIPQNIDEAKKVLDDIDKRKRAIAEMLNFSDTPVDTRLEQIKKAKSEFAKVDKALPAISNLISGFVFDQESKANPNISPYEVGKKIFAITNPDQYALFQDAGGDQMYRAGGTYGQAYYDTPKKADAINRQITELGINAFQLFGNKAAMEKADEENKSLKWNFTGPIEEETKHMIAAGLKEQGISPGSATDEQKDAIANILPDTNREIWFDKNKQENNTDLPTTGFLSSTSRSYHNTIEDAIKSTIGAIVPGRGREIALDVLENQTSSNVLGENPASVARLNQLKEKEKDEDLTPKELAEKKSLEKFTNIRTDWQKFKDLSGQGLGQFAGFGTISAFTGGGLANSESALGSLKSLISPATGRGGTFAAGYLMSLESNLRDAEQMFPGEGNDVKKYAYGQVASTIDAASELIFQEEKFLDLKGAKKEVADLIPKLTAGNIRKELNTGLAEKIAKTFVKAVVKQQETPLEESAEEMISAALKDVFHGILDPDSNAMSMPDVISAGTQAYLSSQFLGVPKGVMATRNKAVPLNAIWDVASDPRQYMDVKMTILEMKQKGELTQEQANERISLLNTARQNWADNPVLSGGLGDLPLAKKQNYLARLMNEQVLQKKADETTDDVVRADYNKQIAESKEARKKLYSGETEVTDKNDEVPVRPEVKKMNDQWKKNIVAIGERTDISEAEKEKLKEAEDDRHATEIAGIEKVPTVESAVIEINGKQYEGKNHAEAILKAKEAGEDISQVNRQAEGKFKLSDGTIIDRATTKEKFGQDRSELLIPQDEAANKANDDYKKINTAKNPEQVETELREQLGEEKSTQLGKDVQGFVEAELLPKELSKAEKDEAIKNPLGFLKAVADQANTPLKIGDQTIDTKERAISKYGEETVKLAQEVFPATPVEEGSGVADAVGGVGDSVEGGKSALGAQPKEVKGSEGEDISSAEKKEWAELSMQEKLKLAQENLPEVDNMSNKEVVELADQNAKMLLGKMREQVKADPVQSMADRIVSGEQMSSDEDLQFYENNKETIEKELKDRFVKQAAKEAPVLTEPERKKYSDAILAFADKILKADITGSGGGSAMANLFSIPQQALGRAMQIIGKSVQAGEHIVDAIKKGIQSLSDEGYDIDGKEFSGFVQSIAAGEKPKIRVPGRDAKKLSGKNETFITHAETEDIRERYGFDNYAKGEPETLAEWDAEAAERIKKGEMQPLLDKLREGNYQPSAVEQRMMLQHIAYWDDIVSKNPTNENFRQYKEVVELSDRAGGSEVGKSLAARKGGKVADDTLASFMLQTAEESGVDELTQGQKVANQIQFKELQDAKKNFEEWKAKKEAEFSEREARLQVEEMRKKLNPRKKKTSEDLAAERKSIVEDILAKFQKDDTASFLGVGKLGEIAPDVLKLARNLLESGVVKLEDLVNQIHGALKTGLPDLEKSEINQIIAGKYNEKRSTKTQLMTDWRDIQQEAKYIDQLEKLEKGVLPASEVKLIKRNQKLKDLREKIKNHPLTKQSEQRKADTKKLEDLQERYNKLEAGEEPKKNVQEKREVSSEIKELQEKIKNHDLQLIADEKQRMKTQIAKIKDQLDRGDFSKEVKKKVELDEEGKNLQRKWAEVKRDREIYLLKQKYDQRSKKEKSFDQIAKVFNVPRSIMASMDFSAILNQGLIPAISHPKMAIEALKQMKDSTISEAEFNRWFHDIKESPRWDLIKDKMKVRLTDPFSPFLEAREEAFGGGYAESIPFIGTHLIKGSERAYVQFLNKLRWDMANKLADRWEAQGKTPENSERLYKFTGRFVNDITGSGHLPHTLEQYASFFNSVFFSPRLMVSRLRLLTPYYWAYAPKELRKEYFKEMGTALGTVAAVVMGFYIKSKSQSDDDPNKIRVELDPRSSDFFKIRQGNTRWNPLGGFQPLVRLGAQEWKGQTKSTESGIMRELNGEGFHGKTRLGAGLDFVRGKLSPIASGSVDLLSGKDMVGNPITLKDAVKKNFIPLTIQSIMESWNQYGGLGSILKVGVPSALGIGVQSYAPHEKEIKKTITYNEKINGETVLRKAKLTDEQYKDYEALSRKYINKDVEKLKKMPEYQGLNIEDQVQVKSTIETAAQKKAEKEIVQKYKSSFPKETAEEKKEREDRSKAKKTIKKQMK